MKKLLLPVLLILSISCKNKDYPELIDEHLEINVSQDPDSWKYLPDYMSYKMITTKDSKSRALTIAKKHPWSYTPEDALVKQVFNRIEQHVSAFTAYQDSKSDKKSSNLFYFQSIIQLSESEMKEYQDQGFISDNPILSEIKGKVIKYELVNEKNEKVNLKDMAIQVQNGILDSKDRSVQKHISFYPDQTDHPFKSLKGKVEIEIEAPYQYDKIKINKEDIGKTITLNGQKIEILELSANIVHLKLLPDAAHPETDKFSVFFDNCSLDYKSALYVNEATYNKARSIPGLSYEEFKKRYKEIGIQSFEPDNQEDNSVETSTPHKNQAQIMIYKSACQIENVYIYCINKSKVTKRTIAIPVNIKVN